MSNEKRKRKGGAAPIYSVALVWIIMSVFMPLYSVGRIIAAVIVSAIIYSAVSGASKPKDGEESAPEEEKKEEPSEQYSPEVAAIVKEGKTAQQELGRLYASIGNIEVKKKIRDIMEISDKIISDAVADPSDVPQIKKFLDYYLPTTIKLLNAYDRMGAQGIEGDNITGTMSSIEEMLDTAIDAYKKLLDSLFADQAMDIETDIEVMNTLLKREGLSGEAAPGFGK